MASDRLVPPLASIDEANDDQVDLIPEQHSVRNGPKFLDLLSPVSSESVSSRVAPGEDHATDTGFFSTPSSKRSSMEVLELQIHLNHNQNQNFRIPKSATEDDILNDEDAELFLEDPTPVPDSVEPESSPECSPDLSGSLEDLVNSFDDAVTTCLKDYDSEVRSIAPQQHRSPDDVIQHRPAWWTLTGNYGDILPIDWEKLSRPLSQTSDESSSLSGEVCELKTAEQLLAEMEVVLNNNNNNNNNNNSDSESMMDQIPLIRRTSIYRFSLDKLRTFPAEQLQELLEDLEGKVQSYSEQLVRRLAHRDELEFERELKRTLLRLVAQVTARRRDLAGDARDRYLNASIPYRKDVVPANLAALQALVQILRAMVDQSPAVSTLLTDYILTHVCPSGPKECPNKDYGKDRRPSQRSLVSLKSASRLFHRQRSNVQTTSQGETNSTTAPGKPILV